MASKLKSNEALRLCKATQDIDELIELTRHADPVVRQRAIKEMCPCRVKGDIDSFWRRMLEMVNDPAANVRQQILHDLCDGSPSHLELDVTEALEEFNRDSDPGIRRMAHKVMVNYRKKGKWNVL